MVRAQPGPRIRGDPGHRAADGYRSRQHRALVQRRRCHYFLWRPGRAGRHEYQVLARALLRFALHAVLGMVSLMHKFRSSLVIALCLLPALAPAARVKDLAVISGVRSNQLVGYGLVVGLDGTGDQTT